MQVNIPISEALAVALGKEFAKARIDAGIPQTAVATKAEVSNGYVSQLERGRMPEYTVFQALCAAVKVTPRMLATRIMGGGPMALRKKADRLRGLFQALEEVL